jgi:hypothetical protein
MGDACQTGPRSDPRTPHRMPAPTIPKMHQSVRAHDSPSQAVWTSTMRHRCHFLSVEATIYRSVSYDTISHHMSQCQSGQGLALPPGPHRVQSSRSRTPSAGARRETNGPSGPSRGSRANPATLNLFDRNLPRKRFASQGSRPVRRLFFVPFRIDGAQII